MATLNENITRIEEAKVAIKNAIIGKGVAVDDTALLDTYASKINEIPTGGSFTFDINSKNGAGWTYDSINSPVSHKYDDDFPIILSRVGTVNEDLKKTADFKAKGGWTGEAGIVYGAGWSKQLITKRNILYMSFPDMEIFPEYEDTITFNGSGTVVKDCPKLKKIPSMKVDFDNSENYSEYFNIINTRSSSVDIESIGAIRFPSKVYKTFGNNNASISSVSLQILPIMVTAPNLKSIGGFYNFYGQLVLNGSQTFETLSESVYVSIFESLPDLTTTKCPWSEQMISEYLKTESETTCGGKIALSKSNADRLSGNNPTTPVEGTPLKIVTDKGWKLQIA